MCIVDSIKSNQLQWKKKKKNKNKKKIFTLQKYDHFGVDTDKIHA